MKNFYLILLILSLLNNLSYAQCDPDTNLKFSGIYPKPIDGLDTAFVDEQYSQVMTCVIPKDTVVFGKSMPIDSIGINFFDGLPFGFTMQPNSLSSYWKGGTSGCVLISGAPVDSQIRDYPLSIGIIAVVGGLPTPFSVPGYSLKVMSHSGIPQWKIEKTGCQLSVTGNFNNQINIAYSSKEIKPVIVQIININGRIVYSEKQYFSPGMNYFSIDSQKIEEGFYALQVVDGIVNPVIKFSLFK